MFNRFRRKNRTSLEAPLPRRRPSVEFFFLDEEYPDDANTFMRLPFVPRQGEEVHLDGDFRRRGCFVVERVEYLLVCNERRNGWVREEMLDVHVNLYVRESSPPTELLEDRAHPERKLTDPERKS